MFLLQIRFLREIFLLGCEMGLGQSFVLFYSCLIFRGFLFGSATAFFIRIYFLREIFLGRFLGAFWFGVFVFCLACHVAPSPSQVLPDYKTRCEQEIAENNDSPEVVAGRAWFMSAVRRFLSAGARGGDEAKPTRFRQHGGQRMKHFGLMQHGTVGLCICFVLLWALIASGVHVMCVWMHPLLLYLGTGVQVCRGGRCSRLSCVCRCAAAAACAANVHLSMCMLVWPRGLYCS